MLNINKCKYFIVQLLFDRDNSVKIISAQQLTPTVVDGILLAEEEVLAVQLEHVHITRKEEK